MPSVGDQVSFWDGPFHRVGVFQFVQVREKAGCWRTGILKGVVERGKDTGLYKVEAQELKLKHEDGKYVGHEFVPRVRRVPPDWVREM